jgi:Rrf2 family iron-sulfur cluster assembly transcriptional regulator
MNMIPVAKIIAAVDEELQFTRCDGDAVEGCVKGERCNAHDLWSSLGRQMMAFLSSITLEDVVEKRNLALAAMIKQTKDRHPEGQPA